LLGLNNKLDSLQREGKTINVAIAGVGQMGKGLISHMRDLKGFKVLAVANRDIERTVKIAYELGIKKSEAFVTGNEDKISDKNITIEKITGEGGIVNRNIKKQLDEAVKEGKIIITNDLFYISAIEDVDVVLDVTGSPVAGAHIALNSIACKKNVVSLNVEADVTIGPILKKFADRYDSVYTVSAGDEPGALKELYDFSDALGLKIVTAGKGKNNPLDRYANPTTLAEYAAAKGSSARMMTSFVDGTKSMIEMACVSNATGLIPDCRGMHGPKANVTDLVEIFKLKKDGGILEKKGVVDFAVGDIAPGVFLVYTTNNEIIKKDLKYLQLGEGPNYLLYRPYHLTSIETPLSIARVYFYNEPTIVPKRGLVSDVITAAKRDLKAGEVIDGIGGYTVYGLIDLYENAKEESLLPIGLAEGSILKRDIKKDQTIKYDDIDFSRDSLLLELRKLQDKSFPS